jgi:anti-repressor protein
LHVLLFGLCHFSEPFRFDNLHPFNFDSYQVRVIDQDGEPWFVAADVCDALEVTNTGQAMTRLDRDERSTIILNDGTPGNPLYVIINESGLYSLILTSRKPEAKRFKKWVVGEVLPSIRKTGSYAVTPQYQIPSSYGEALQLAANLELEKERLTLMCEQKDAILLVREV